MRCSSTEASWHADYRDTAYIYFGGLPFEESCLRFYENARAVRTVSSEQVRRPIFRGGLDQWRAYEPWLDPLKRALGPALEGWRDGA